ncbi:hypothetical protein [Pseudonocardia xishanensis]|uniref:Glycosyltransferase involved in cell wall biosynthesis n=1 Tax=Pseudonocardia xishanensis TaxID=630995 RepID=A0ABP8S2B2_9PSEU
MRVHIEAPGPAGHGVRRHSERVGELVAEVAEAARAGVDVGAAGWRGVAAGGVGSRAAPGGGSAVVDLTHAQFTDALWGPDVASAAEAFVRRAAELPRPLVVTLHDVPGADPDPARDARRTAGYRRVVEAADLVVVSARHEAAKARAFGADPLVIPLPPPAVGEPGPPPAWAGGPSVVVLGFVYPGKGHAEAIAAAAGHPARPRVVAAGAVSPGHEPLWTELCARAAAAGVELVSTGPLGDADLVAAARAATVPLAANRGVSASGSLLFWLACGRVPLAARGEYAAEVATDHPGHIRLYEPTALGAELAAALADPSRTHATPPTWPDVGALHRRAYALAMAPPGDATPQAPDAVCVPPRPVASRRC